MNNSALLSLAECVKLATWLVNLKLKPIGLVFYPFLQLLGLDKAKIEEEIREATKYK